MQSEHIHIGEIEARELAKNLLGGTVVGERGFYLSVKPTNYGGLDSCYKLIPSPENSLNDPVAPWSAMSSVFALGAKPQITPTIIKSIMIDMVNKRRRWRRHYEPVHTDGSAFARWLHWPRYRVNIPATWLDVPTVRLNQRYVAVINKDDMSAWEGELSHHGA